MSLDRIANITINLQERPIPLAGFGIPLIAALLTSPQSSAWDTEYGASTDVAEIAVDTWQGALESLGVSSSADLYVALLDMFSQDEQPETVLLGRRATAVAQVVNVSIDAATDGTFTVTVNGTDYTYAASGTTADVIRDALVTAVDADPAVSAVAGAGDTLDITASVAGVPFTLSTGHSSTPASISSSETTANVGLGDDIGDWRAERDDWYFLLETTRTPGVVQYAAETIETMRKLFVTQSSDADAQTASTTDIGYLLGPLGLNMNRTSVWWNDNDDQFVDAAIVGKMAPKDPGAETWANQTLSSVTGIEPTSASNLIAKRYSWLETFTAANFAMTQEGTVASGQFIDLIRGRDWLHNLIQIRIVQALRDAPKIPYTDEGADIIGSVIRGALAEAAAKGLVDADTIVVNVPPKSQQTATDIGNRRLAGITFSATLLGAVHTLDITGNLAP